MKTALWPGASPTHAGPSLPSSVSHRLRRPWRGRGIVLDSVQTAESAYAGHPLPPSRHCRLDLSSARRPFISPPPTPSPQPLLVAQLTHIVPALCPSPWSRLCLASRSLSVLHRAPQTAQFASLHDSRHPYTLWNTSCICQRPTCVLGLPPLRWRLLRSTLAAAAGQEQSEVHQVRDRHRLQCASNPDLHVTQTGSRAIRIISHHATFSHGALKLIPSLRPSSILRYTDCTARATSSTACPASHSEHGGLPLSYCLARACVGYRCSALPPLLPAVVGRCASCRAVPCPLQQGGPATPTANRDCPPASCKTCRTSV